MRKKYGLFKILTIILLLIMLVTYFMNSRDEIYAPLAIIDVILNYIQSFYYFFDTAIFILIVGGFYGFLNHVPAYKKLVKQIAEFFKEKGKMFVVITTIAFALISSLTGLNVILLLFIPFIISIILLLGYDKLVAISATIGGTISGLIGAIFLTLKDSSDYEVTYITIDEFIGLDSIWGNIFPKVLLLVVVTGLLIFYILNHIKKVETKEEKYKLTKSDSLFFEVKDRKGEVVKYDDSKTLTWPLAILLLLFLAIIVLGYVPWKGIFGIDCFEKFHSWIVKFNIGDHGIFTGFITNNIGAFGTWRELGNYLVAIVVLIILMIITMLTHRIKFEEAMDGFIYGTKKMIPAVIIVMLAYCVLVCSYNHGFSEVIIKAVSKEFGDNAVIHSLLTGVGSVLHVDLQYTTNAILNTVVSSLTKDANLSIYVIMFQSIYGMIQLVGPTSILLLVGLMYLDVPYKTWLKYIWRFIVELIIVIMIVLMIVSLL